MTKPKVLLRFDTEDYITPESNIALYDILQILEELQIKATFCLVGQKLKMLANNKETKILKLLQHHALGYHSYLHSFHPLAMEYLEERNWEEGVREFLQVEDQGHKLFVEIFNQPPICYTQPGADWVPHAYIALQEWEVPFFFSDAKYALLNYQQQPFIVNGILTFANEHVSTDLTNLATSPATLQQLEERFAEEYQRILTGPAPSFLTLVCHPDRLVAAGNEPWDVLQFANGKNTALEQWQSPPLKNKQLYQEDLHALREFLTFLTQKYDFDWITAEDLVHIFQKQLTLKDRVLDTLTQQSTATNATNLVDFATVQAIAKSFTQNISFYQFKENWLSPIQAASILCQALLIRAKEHYFPHTVPLPTEIFFPDQIPKVTVDQNLDRLGWAELIQGSTTILQQIKQTASFPLKIKVGGNLWIDLAKFIGGVAQAIVTMTIDHVPQDRVLLPSTRLQTTDLLKKIDQVQWSWPIFRYGYRNGQILQATELLSWTMKPLLPLL